MQPSFLKNKCLSEVCTFGIGGPADSFIEIDSISDMQRVLSFCTAKPLQYFILGKGSNCLFDSQGFAGVVLQNKIDFCDEIKPGIFYVGAGYSFSLLGTQTAKKGWTGLEFASGIPASVGGALFMNAAAQGMQTCQALSFVDYVEPDGTLKRLSREDILFGYRFSSFQKMKGAIVAACFILSPFPEARAKQLQLLKARIETQPYHEKSAGCIFKNPSCCAAAQLIDQCGLKGHQIGGARVSEMHANFLINVGSATSQDILDLRDFVRDEVFRQTEVLLEPEVYWVPAMGRDF